MSNKLADSVMWHLEPSVNLELDLHERARWQSEGSARQHEDEFFEARIIPAMGPRKKARKNHPHALRRVVCAQ